MKFFATILAATSVLAAVSIEEYFPACSVDCLKDATLSASDCTLEDAVCQCVRTNYESIVGVATPCVMKECGADAAVGEVLPAAGEFCLAASASASADTATATSASAETSTESDNTAETTTSSVAADDAETTTDNSASSETTTAAEAGAATAAPALAGMVVIGALALF